MLSMLFAITSFITHQDTQGDTMQHIQISSIHISQSLLKNN